MKAAIYSRVSTDSQEAEGTSLQTQLEACLSYCRDKGYDVVYQFSETYSGLSLARPQLDKLRGQVRDREIDILVVLAIDRWSRDPVHGVILTQELEKHGVTLEAVTETVDSSEVGKLINYIKGFASKLETEKIKERTARGRKARVASGKLASGRANYLFGYSYIPGRGEGQGIRRINPETSEVVRSIFTAYADEGLYLNEIVDRLDSLGIKTLTGKSEWAKASIRTMLKNPAYYGTNLATPGIISKELFDRVQQKLIRNKELAKRSAKRDFLLSGYVFCGDCGRRFQGRTKSYPIDGGRTYTRYYLCAANRWKGTHKCNNLYSRADMLEGTVWAEIEKAISNPDIILLALRELHENPAKMDGYQQELNEVISRLLRLDNEQQDLLHRALQSGFTESVIAKENKRINIWRDMLNKRKADTEAMIDAAKQSEVNIKDITEAIRTLKQNIIGLSFETKREFLESLRVRVSVKGNHITIEGFLPTESSHLVGIPASLSNHKMPKDLPFSIAVKSGGCK